MQGIEGYSRPQEGRNTCGIEHLPLEDCDPQRGFCVVERTSAKALLDSYDGERFWKSMFVAFGHATAYFVSLATEGRPPSISADGEPFAAPQSGMFVAYNKGRLDYYNDRYRAILPMQISFFAEGVGNLDAAEMWAQMGFQSAQENGLGLIASMTVSSLLPSIL